MRPLSRVAFSISQFIEWVFAKLGGIGVIDLALAELKEIERVIAQLLTQPATATDYDTLLARRFPGAYFVEQLTAVERHQWLNQLRGYLRGERIPEFVSLQPALPFTGGVSESNHQK